MAKQMEFLLKQLKYGLDEWLKEVLHLKYNKIVSRFLYLIWRKQLFNLFVVIIPKLSIDITGTPLKGL